MTKKDAKQDAFGPIAELLEKRRENLRKQIMLEELECARRARFA